jgi:hypothetical protein
VAFSSVSFWLVTSTVSACIVSIVAFWTVTLSSSS